MKTYSICKKEEENSRARAKASGDFIIHIGDTTHLLLDLDSIDALVHAEVCVKYYKKQLNIIEIEKWKSKSKGWHWKIKLGIELPRIEIIAWQGVFGSDPIRNGCSLITEMWPALFQPIKSEVEVVSYAEKSSYDTYVFSM